MPRKWRKEISIERIRELFAYDSKTGIVTRRVARPRTPVGSVVGCINGRYLVVCVDYETLMVHRIVWVLHYGKPPPDHLDHINGDGTDNRICNIRECTQTTNNQNMRPRRKKNGLPKGVTIWQKKKGISSLSGKDRGQQARNISRIFSLAR